MPVLRTLLALLVLASVAAADELAAEELMTQTFCRAFAACPEPTADDIDSALVAALRDYAARAGWTDPRTAQAWIEAAETVFVLRRRAKH